MQEGCPAQVLEGCFELLRGGATTLVHDDEQTATRQQQQRDHSGTPSYGATGDRQATCGRRLRSRRRRR